MYSELEYMYVCLVYLSKHYGSYTYVRLWKYVYNVLSIFVFAFMIICDYQITIFDGLSLI